MRKGIYIIFTTFVFSISAISLQAQKTQIITNEKKQTIIQPETNDNQVMNLFDNSFTKLMNSSYLEIEPEQSWKIFNNPNPELNFNITGNGLYAGDIDDDGQSDFIFSVTTRDERTDDLSDKVGKTAVYFSDSYTSGTDYDQFLYELLDPVGDLNGDGYSDAILKDINGLSNGTTFFEGSDTGYQSTGINLSENQNSSIRSFIDIDGDGYEDVISYDAYILQLMLGADDLNNVDFSTINFDNNARVRDLAFADITGDGTDEIIVLRHDYSDFTEIHVYETNTDRELSLVWHVITMNLYQNLQAADLNGNGNIELILDNYIVEYNEELSDYDFDNPINTGSFNVIGDVDNDGRMDVLHSLDSDYIVAYGTDDLTEWDGSLPADYTINLDLEYINESNRNNIIGDVDGDGIDDFDLNYIDGDETGRIIVSGAEDRSHETQLATFNVDEYSGDYVNKTENIGDVNNDGVDDFALFHSTFNKERISVYYGGNDISDTPDIEIPLDGRDVMSIVPGDYNGDGETDLAISLGDQYGNNAADDDIIGIHIIYNADVENFDVNNGNSDHYISFSDVTGYEGNGVPYTNGGFSNLVNPGDLNGDGVDDLLYSAPAMERAEANETVYITYGGNSINTAPDETIPDFIGDRLLATGDVTGDGEDDFAVLSIFTNEVALFYNDENGEYNNPDHVLSPDGEYFVWGLAVAAGDLNSDGINDVVVKPFTTLNSSVNPLGLDIFYGGESISETPDKHIDIPVEAISNLQNPEDIISSLNNIEIIPDLFGEGYGGIFHGTNFSYTNALIFQGHEGVSSDPAYVLKAPNQSSGLGAINNFIYFGTFDAYGDFDGDGNMDLVLTQANDNNDMNSTSRIYRYSVPQPITLTNVEDRENDQGGWVVLHYEGSYIDAQQEGVKLFNELEVQRMDDGEWISTGMVIKNDEDLANRVEIPVPVTMPSDAESESDYELTYRLTAFDNSSTVLARSNQEAGFALDNIAPAKVQDVTVDKSDEVVAVEWQPVSDNDVAVYEIYSADITDFAQNEPIASTADFGAEIERGDHEQIIVVAKDIHNNYGEPSDANIVTSGERLADVPDEYDLEQNYPNPFNPSTEISYDLPQSSHTRITVFNNIGQRVAVLVDQVQSAGSHQVTFNARELPSGMYFYRIEAGSFTQTRKMMLIK
ncbi:MAG: FG-GAP-like repeat-containing protein [Balneolaceae bacterium]